ncbi:hypothetical protein [Streptomyces sp. NPDC004134]|uniref:hypothetical protein n=1 Tax=Streptomyces sp. NPDC004134 TaxID=3364691 RepID=UPI0036C6C043
MNSLSRPRFGTLARLALPSGLVLVLAAGTVAGATSGDRSEPVADDVPAVRLLNEGWPSAVADSGLARDLSLPLEKYLPSYREMVAVDTARREVEKDCMTGLGLAWTPPVLFVDPSFSYNAMNTPRRYGITIASEAKQHGYDLPLPSSFSSGEEATPTDVEAAVLKGHDAAGKPVAEVAGIDVPDGGCRGVSAEDVGDLGDSLAGELAGQSLNTSEAHPDVVAAVAAWSACMADQGYETDHPYNAANITTASTQEVAVADIGCKESTDLVGIWYRVESEIQQDLIAEHRTALEQEAQHNVAVVAAAEAIE